MSDEPKDGRESAVMLTANIIKQYLPENGKLEDVARAAFDGALDDTKAWMLKDDDARLLAGTGALLLHYKNDHDMRHRIESELTLLRSMSAAASGIPVNFDAIVEDDFEPVGLLNAFREAKERAK